MKNKAGLWIDHERAAIVMMTPRGEEMLRIQSRVETQPSRSAGIRSTTHYESQKVPADDSRQRKLTGQQNIFYDAVIAAIRDADAILIFGPSEAKGQLSKRLAKDGLHGRVVAVETTGKMSERQIAAKVREHFRAKGALEPGRKVQNWSGNPGRRAH